MTLFNHWLFWMKDCRFQQTVVNQRILAGLQEVYETSSRHVLKKSSTRLQRTNFSSSKTSWRLLQDVLDDKKLLRWGHVLKTFWRHVLKTSCRRLVEKQKVFWGCLYLTNINSNKSIFPKFISDETKTNPKCID